MQMIDNIPVYRTSIDEGALAQIETWPSGKGTSLSMKTRWVRLPSTSP
jgi:hypothetical protein